MSYEGMLWSCFLSSLYSSTFPLFLRVNIHLWIAAYSWLLFLLSPLLYCGSSTVSTYLSIRSRKIFESSGLIIPPCGVPLRVLWYFHSSRYPALRRCSISLTKQLSWMFSLRMFSTGHFCKSFCRRHLRG